MRLRRIRLSQLDSVPDYGGEVLERGARALIADLTPQGVRAFLSAHPIVVTPIGQDGRRTLASGGVSCAVARAVLGTDARVTVLEEDDPQVARAAGVADRLLAPTLLARSARRAAHRWREASDSDLAHLGLQGVQAKRVMAYLEVSRSQYYRLLEE